MKQGEIWLINLDPTTADCFQVRSVSISRFIKKIGSVSMEDYEDIKIGLSRVLSIE